jgi:hypothetical protein
VNKYLKILNARFLTFGLERHAIERVFIIDFELRKMKRSRKDLRGLKKRNNSQKTNSWCTWQRTKISERLQFYSADVQYNL